jgi:hypothetical protein
MPEKHPKVRIELLEKTDPLAPMAITLVQEVVHARPYMVHEEKLKKESKAIPPSRQEMEHEVHIKQGKSNIRNGIPPKDPSLLNPRTDVSM